MKKKHNKKKRTKTMVAKEEPQNALEFNNTYWGKQIWGEMK